MNIATPVSPTLTSTKFQFPGQTSFYQGKVRDVYTIDNKLMVMIVTDRISAFDVVLPKAIPYKGQVLNQIALRMMDATKNIVPNWIDSVPDPNVTIGRLCTPFKIEMVIRGYLSGYAWREYRAGKRLLCGIRLPEVMKENDRFPEPIITPSTKASVGHDEDVSKEEIISRGLVDEKDYKQLEDYTRSLFKSGSALALKRGLLLVDTKYEFGKSDNRIFLIDEIHTPDSSRYFYADGYEKRQERGEDQKQLSKEFVRQWLLENNFSGKEDQVVPEMTEEWVNRISERYVELYEKLSGEKFIKADTTNITSRIEKNTLKALIDAGFR